MGKLYGDSLEASLPESIAADAQVQNITTAIQEKLWEIKRQTELLLLLPRLNSLPENLVDELAWEYHVDFYRPALPLDVKRNLVRRAIAWHRIKGTPAAIEEVCSTVFKHAEVYENWQYGGQPYHFKVLVVKEDIPNADTIEMLMNAIDETKNTRSWLDEIGFYREYFYTAFWGVGFSKRARVDVLARRFAIPKIEKHFFVSMTTLARKKYNLKAVTFTLPDHFDLHQQAANIISMRNRFIISATAYKALNINVLHCTSAFVNIFRRYTIYG